MGSKAFENPLLSHARMRGIYRGLVEARALAARLAGPAPMLEACWVAPAIGLEDGDFTSVAEGDALLAWLTQIGDRAGNPASRALRRLLGAAPSPFAGTALERALCAVGAAMALAGGEGKGVAIAWLGQADMTGAQWARVLALTASVPLLLVAMPGGKKAPDLHLVGRRTGVPVVPVDAADAVALYRVVQESLVRAREDRQGAVIECVASGTDPILAMAGQLVGKKICTPRWVDAVAASPAAWLPAAAASRRSSGATAART